MVDFAVVVPLYNREEFIRDALNSVYSQELAPKEVVVVDDGSTDASFRIVTDEYPLVKLLRQENAGPGPARNHGVLASSMDWVAFLDSDDVWRPNHLRELASIISAFPEIGLACTGFLAVSQSSMESKFGPSPNGNLRLIDYFAEDAPAFTSSTAVRRESIEAVGGFLDRVPGQDKELWARIACQFDVGMSSASTAVYRTGAAGITETIGRRTRPTPQCLEDVSITLATVSRSLQSEGTIRANRDSLRSFLNKRLEIKVKQKLIEGDLAYARALCQFFNEPVGKQRQMVLALSFSPAPLIRLAVKVAMSQKHLQ